MVLTFYTNMTKGLKLKVRRFWRVTLTFAEVTEEKLVGQHFFALPSILNKVNVVLVFSFTKSLDHLLIKSIQNNIGEIAVKYSCDIFLIVNDIAFFN